MVRLLTGVCNHILDVSIMLIEENICSKRMFVMMVLPVFLLIHVGEHFLLSLLDGVSRKNIL